MKQTMYLHFYGVLVAVSSDNQEIAANLTRDFAYFIFKQKSSVYMTITLYLKTPPYHIIPSLKASMYLPEAIVYDDGNARYVDYQGEALTIYDRKKGKAEIFSKNPHLLHEITYLFILSTVGEALDRHGLHRLHALGITYKEQALVCLLPQGGGKTTLALELLRYKNIEILSDDTPLITKSGAVLPFPLRFGMKKAPKEIPKQFVRPFERRKFGKKYLVDIAYFHDKIRGAASLQFVFIGQRHMSGESRIAKISKIEAMGAFFANCVVGLGLPQVVEYFFRSDAVSILSLFRIAASRLFVSIGVILRSKTYTIVLGTDTQKNAQTLYKFLQSTSP